jgi:hypothetical protein
MTVLAMNWIEFILWPLGIYDSGRYKVVEKMEKGNRSGPNLKVLSQHLPGGIEEKSCKNLNQYGRSWGLNVGSFECEYNALPLSYARSVVLALP